MTKAIEQDELPLEPLRRQDPLAFAHLVERHPAVVLGLAQVQGLRGADLDDATAEVFANVYRALPRFEDRSTLATWIYRIACRTIPKARARHRSSAGLPMRNTLVDARQPTPLDAVETADRNQRVWEAVEKLEIREALEIEMCYRRGWTVAQIAEVLECPQGTIKTLLFRARQKLRQSLTARGLGEGNDGPLDRR